jgi:hypothetical protein
MVTASEPAASMSDAAELRMRQMSKEMKSQFKQQEFAEAEKTLHRTRDLATQNLGPDHWQTKQISGKFGEIRGGSASRSRHVAASGSRFWPEPSADTSSQVSTGSQYSRDRSSLLSQIDLTNRPDNVRDRLDSLNEFV